MFMRPPQCYNKGAYEEAVSLLNKAINAEKNEKGIYINRGDCFLRLEEYLYALADYRQVTRYWIGLVPMFTGSVT